MSAPEHLHERKSNQMAEKTWSCKCGLTALRNFCCNCGGRRETHEVFGVESSEEDINYATALMRAAHTKSDLHSYKFTIWSSNEQACAMRLLEKAKELFGSDVNKLKADVKYWKGLAEQRGKNLQDVRDEHNMDRSKLKDDLRYIEISRDSWRKLATTRGNELAVRADESSTLAGLNAALEKGTTELNELHTVLNELGYPVVDSVVVSSAIKTIRELHKKQRL